MRIFHVILIVKHFTQILCSSGHIFNDENSQFSRTSESLKKLLYRVASDHMAGCDLNIVYDENFRIYRGIDFFSLFRDIPVSIVQNNLAFSRTRRKMPRVTEKCRNYLIFLNDVFSIRDFLIRETTSKIVIVCEDSPWIVKDFLKNHVSSSYMHLLIITHSTSRRTGDGSYLLYTHRLFADGSGASDHLLLGSWLQTSFTNDAIDFFPQKLQGGLKGHRLLVATAHNPPFTIRRSVLGDETVHWDGIEIKIMKMLGAYFNFTIEFHDPESSKLSPMVAAISDVSAGTSSAAIGGIYQTSKLNEIYDVTFPHFDDCASFISLASTALPKHRAVLGPFQLTVWLLLCAAYFIMIIPLTFNTRYTFVSLIKKPARMMHMFWYVFTTYTNSFAVRNPMLNTGIAKNATSLLIGIYWVFTIIITSCYTGSIVAFITLPIYPTAIDSSEELLYYNYRIGTLDHDGWKDSFNYTKMEDPTARKLLRNLEYVPTVLSGVNNASRALFWPYAFLGSKAMLEYIVQTDFAPKWAAKRSLMHISEECFVRYNVVFALSKKSLYTQKFSSMINRAIETGLIKKIVRDIDWDIQHAATGKLLQITKGMSRRLKLEDRQLTLDDTQGMFLILGAGILIGFFTLTVETVVYYIKRCYRKCKGESSVEEYWRNYRIDSWINELIEMRRNSI